MKFIDLLSDSIATPKFPLPEVVLVGEYGEKRIPIALCKLPNDEYELFEECRGRWQKFPLPDSMRKSKFLTFCTDKQTGAICVHNWLEFFYLSNQKWKQVDQHTPENVLNAKKSLRHPTKTLLRYPNFYEAMDGGEWGNGFFSLNLQTGIWSIVEGCDGLAVNDVKADSEGNIWLAQGESDGFSAEGAIRKLSGTKCDTISSVEGGIIKGAEGAIKHTNWNYPPVSMIAVDFDKSGNLFILTDSLGLFRKDGGNWIALTKSFPKVLSFTGFILDGEKHALLATQSHGLIDWDLSSGKYRQILLK